MELYSMVNHTVYLACAIYVLHSALRFLKEHKYSKDLLEALPNLPLAAFGILVVFIPLYLYVLLTYGLPYIIMTELFEMEEIQSIYASMLIFSFISIAIVYFSVKSKMDEIYAKKSKILEEESKKLNKKYEEKHKELQRKEEILDNHDEVRQRIAESREPIRRCASMVADFRTIIYDEAERWFTSKQRPSMRSAEEVRTLKAKTREYISLYKQMQYKYEILMNAFPILREYDEEDDEQSFIDMTSAESLEEVADNRNRARDFLSSEEWSQLTTSQRNQLAFDRWKSGKKSNWTIGMLYEMYAAHVLMKKAGAGFMQFEIIPYGINEGRADLGRDLIVKFKPTLFDRREPITWIMQCKRWKTSRVIRENVICQLYGTTIEYRLKHKDEKNVIPMLVTTTELSDIAKVFAEELGVVVHILPYEDFPMIKCNINNGEKIYHLPFDQQYWRTKIDKKGEFYAMTVAEAEALGFRRAFKHFTQN